ncbi:cation:proton antiporter [Halostagnicola sp. A-GB9-2]|uniref:cation:proton antiporter n=1 Tax=Halostagnicola sp. A-GB9-2 TaxID=3048066 RepID=UPI0024C011F4|nr:cation:proton antiporter [Halostagnicola sp. A-GB9-2]MDJ1432067.1 cation:proton antiporter [Halostagnicola sp. A-GB9-2]
MIEFISILTVVFVVAAIVVLLAARLPVSAIPLYLLTGVLVGAFIDESQILELAQWGIAFLVFLFGVRIDAETLETTGRVGTLTALAQAVLVGGITFILAVVLDLSALNAGYLAVAAALSSSLVGVSYLERAVEFRTTSDRLGESIHFVEDVLGVVVLLALAAFVYLPESDEAVVIGTGIETLLVGTVALFATALAIRRWVFSRLIAQFEGDSEVLMLVGITFVVLGIGVSEAIGVSIAVGAFAAGLAVADEYPYSLELVDTVDDLTDFFVPIFFVTVGALVSLPDATTVTYTVLLLVVVLVVNPLLTAGILRWHGFSERTAVLTGLRLDQLSEFSLVIAIQAAILGTIAPSVFEAIVLAALVTMLVSSYTTHHDEAIYRRLAAIVPGDPTVGGARVETSAVLEDHVVIIGFETVGRVLFEHCLERGHDCLVVVDNPVHAEAVADAGGEYVVGDVVDPNTREHASLESAALIASTLPQRDLNESVAAVETDAPVAVVAIPSEHAEAFYDAGADYVAVPDLEAADRLEGYVERALEGKIEHLRDAVESERIE